MCVVCFLFAGTTQAASIPIPISASPGDKIIAYFDVSLVSDFPIMHLSAWFSFLGGGDTFDSGESFVLDWYEDPSSSQSLRTQVVSAGFDGVITSISPEATFPDTVGGLFDAEGRIEITQIVGTFDVRQIDFSTFSAPAPGTSPRVEAYAVEVVPAVPIPPALYLFGSGLIGLVGVARRTAA